MKRSFSHALFDTYTCHVVARRLQRYLDGEVDGATRLKVERHLETCRTCELDVETYTKIKAALARGVTGVSHADGASLARLRRYVDELTDPEKPSRER